MKRALLSVTASILAVPVVMATPVNITIFDGQAGNGATAPWKFSSGVGAGFEDNETEPKTITGDAWDVEAFVYTPGSKTLSLIGTYDFKNGAVANGINYGSGAIFVRTAGSGSWEYAYVLDLVNNTYTLFDSFSTLAPTDIAASTPWTVDLDKPNTVLGSGSLDYLTDIVDPFGLGLQRQSGTGHNQIDLPLGLLPSDVLNSFETHFTMMCGNDVIKGEYRSVPDSGTTAVLLGLGVIGLIGLRGRALRLAPEARRTSGNC